MAEPRYLGDGVYVKKHELDPMALVITTGSHNEEEADNRIVLELDTARQLQQYILDWFNENGFPL